MAALNHVTQNSLLPTLTRRCLNFTQLKKKSFVQIYDDQQNETTIDVAVRTEAGFYYSDDTKCMVNLHSQLFEIHTTINSPNKHATHLRLNRGELLKIDHLKYSMETLIGGKRIYVKQLAPKGKADTFLPIKMKMFPRGGHANFPKYVIPNRLFFVFPKEFRNQNNLVELEITVFAVTTTEKVVPLQRFRSEEVLAMKPGEIPADSDDAYPQIEQDPAIKPLPKRGKIEDIDAAAEPLPKRIKIEDIDEAAIPQIEQDRPKRSRRATSRFNIICVKGKKY